MRRQVIKAVRQLQQSNSHEDGWFLAELLSKNLYTGLKLTDEEKELIIKTLNEHQDYWKLKLKERK